jgi:HK97 family phage major capsid protein
MAVWALRQGPALHESKGNNMADLNEIKSLVVQQGEDWKTFQKQSEDRIKTLEAETNELAKKAGRPFAAASTSDSTNSLEKFIDTKTGKAIPVLKHGDKLASLEGKATDQPSVGRLLRGIVLGGQARDAEELAIERKTMSIFSDPTGGYTVGGALSNEWIDALRANMVLSKAGVRTLPMETGQVSIARVISDPQVYWHKENDALHSLHPENTPTFGRVTLNAKTCVCLCKMSLELSQDSANIEQILESTLINAMAQSIDSAGLIGVTTDAGAAPSGIMNLTDRNKVTTIGAPTSWDFLVDGMYELAADNVPMDNIGAFIAHPAVWKKMRKLKTGITNDNTPLTMPAEIAALPKLWTTAAPLTGGTTAAGIIGNWRDLIFGVRNQITVRVLSEAYMGDSLQIALLAYARVDFAATRPESFCTLEGITV